MSLAETVTRLLSQRNLTLGLAMKGNELVDANYVRRDPAWKVDQARMSAEVTFGPFAGPVEFDRAVLFDGDDVAQTILLEEPARLPAGMSFKYRATVRTAA